MKRHNRHPHFDIFLMDTEKCISVDRASKSHDIRVKGQYHSWSFRIYLSALCGEGVHLSETPNLASFDAAFCSLRTLYRGARLDSMPSTPSLFPSPAPLH